MLIKIRADFRSLFEDCKSLIDIKKRVLSFFRQVRKQNSRIGYVAGVITSDGPDKIEANRKKLVKITQSLEQICDFPLFSAVDIFSDEVYRKIPYFELKYEEREQNISDFWEGLLSSGYITDIFMTPGWERSKGATLEYNIAKAKGLKIHKYKDFLASPNRSQLNY